MRKLAVLCVLIVCCAGCYSLSRWYAPILPTDLPAASQKALADKDAEMKAAIAASEKTIAKLTSELKKAREASVPFWLYLIAGLAIVAGPAVGYFLKQWIAGALAALGGLGLLATLQFLSAYPWACWIPFGLMILALAGVAYKAYLGTNAQTALKAIVPVVEALGTAADPLKASIETKAGKTLPQVKSAVSAVKASLNL